MSEPIPTWPASLRVATRYGVTLARLQEDDIEIVRSWRNDPEISQFMVFRDHITPEMQVAWFRSIDPLRDFYFVVEVDGEKAGLIDVKRISWETRSGDAGSFYQKRFHNSIVPFQGSFSGLEFVFDELRLDYLEARTLKDNRRAIRFNTSLGYELQPGQDDVENQLYICTRESFERKTLHLRKALRAAIS